MCIRDRLGAVGAVENDALPLLPGAVRIFAALGLWVLFSYLAGAFDYSQERSEPREVQRENPDAVSYTHLDVYKRQVYETAAGDIDPDAEQRLPTYEDILSLPVEDIAAADYRTFSDIPCLYVETGERDGYVQRYWVSVESGLLVGAEKLQNGETVYRAAERPEESPAVATADFTLPDGTVLHTVE